MVWANGFDQNNLMHSTGHNTVFKLVNSYNESIKDKEKSTSIKTVLVVSSNKMDDNKIVESSSGDKNERDETRIDRDGSYFWKGEQNEITRENIWIPRDKSVLNDLYDKEIMFFNPREDIIPISDLDFIICDTKNEKESTFEIKTEDENKTKSNKGNFIKAIKEHIKKEWNDILT